MCIRDSPDAQRANQQDRQRGGDQHDQHRLQKVFRHRRGNAIPVSYTHLDVYKRQGIERGVAADDRAAAYCLPAAAVPADDLL